MTTSNSRQALWIGIGSFFSILVGIINPMILSRVFSKVDYGTFKQVMYVYSTLVTVFTLGLPKAYSYFLPKYEKVYSKDIINKISKIFYMMGIIFSLFIFSLSDVIAKFLNNDDLSIALKIFSPTPFFLLSTFGLEGIYATFKKAQFITIYTIVTRVLTVLLTILPVIVFNGTYIHAIVGFNVASFLSFLLTIYMKSFPVRNVSHEKSGLTYKLILSFSLPLLYASLWGLVIGSTTQFFISRYYGVETFADFSNGFMEVPFASLVVSSVATVLLPRLSELGNEESRNDVIVLWRSAFIKSAKVIFPILIFSVVFARPIMVCLYGKAYEASAIYFKIKNLSSLFYIVPFAPIMLAIGKTRTFANIHMITAFLIVISEFICIKTFYSPILLAFVSEICQVFKLYLMMKVVSNYAKQSILNLLPVKNIIRIFIASLFSALLSNLLLMPFEFNILIYLVVAVILFCISFYVFCITMNISYKEIFSTVLSEKMNKILLRYVP